jgi:2-polyprenyl-6-methoxyphenol hydroxylase-like FAD-dependent oxidoreductase
MVQMTQAVIIGGGICGLLTARVLSDFFDTVAVVEKDDLSPDCSIRTGVPQTVQPHILLAKGFEVLGELLPDIKTRLLDGGATPIDWGKEFKIYLRDGWGANTSSSTGITSMVASRALLERSIRNEVFKIGNIKLYSSCNVKKLIYNPKNSNLSGVKVYSRELQRDRKIEGDLIVDCSGRNSQASYWLQAIGYTAPPETVVDAGLGYSTLLFHVPPDFTTSWRIMKLSHMAPERTRLGFLSRIEGDRLIATLGGYCRDYPPTTPDEFFAYAKTLPSPEFANIIANLTPASPVYAYRATGNKRKHYEKTELPANFITLGDAVCFFCPVYGQGMTVAVLSVKVLEDWLSRNRGRDLNSRDFQRKLAKLLDLPWNFATSSDAPFISGREKATSPVFRLLQRYNQRVFDKMSADPEVYRTAMAVSQLVDSPVKLFNPSFMLRVLS